MRIHECVRLTKAAIAAAHRAGVHYPECILAVIPHVGNDGALYRPATMDLAVDRVDLDHADEGERRFQTFVASVEAMGPIDDLFVEAPDNVRLAAYYVVRHAMDSAMREVLRPIVGHDGAREILDFAHRGALVPSEGDRRLSSAIAAEFGVSFDED